MKNNAGESKNMSQSKEAARGLVCFWAARRVARLDQRVYAVKIKEINLRGNSFERCIRIYNCNVGLHICDGSKPNSSFECTGEEKYLWEFTLPQQAMATQWKQCPMS